MYILIQVESAGCDVARSCPFPHYTKRDLILPVLNLASPKDMADLQLSPVLDELTKKSIDLLGRLIKKPPLTQKLLAKPPFRYLHDLFSELISTAGFAPGLYNEIESNSENVKVTI